MQLLGTAADIADDTGSTWGSGGENDQKLAQSIAPDYRGLVRSRTIWSGNRAFIDFDAEAGAFAVGLVVTGAGATGLITHVVTNGTVGTLYMRSVVGAFVDDGQIIKTGIKQLTMLSVNFHINNCSNTSGISSCMNPTASPVALIRPKRPSFMVFCNSSFIVLIL